MNVWETDCGHAWCIKHDAKFGMYTAWGDNRVGLMLERAANLASGGASPRSVLDWIYAEMASMANDEQGEVFDTVVRDNIAAALELVWMIEYGDSLSPASGLARI